jgi:hypothetical protein
MKAPATLSLPPARYADPTDAQAEVLLAMDPESPNHVVEIAAASALGVDCVRRRLDSLDRKHMVVGIEGDVFLNVWAVTELGRLHRDRLAGASV